jgi:hypothetical protein
LNALRDLWQTTPEPNEQTTAFAYARLSEQIRSETRSVRSATLTWRRRLHRPRLALAGLVVVLLAVLAATPALGLRGRVVHLFAAGTPAPAPVVRSFAEMERTAPAGMAPGVIADQTREVTRFPLANGQTVVLSVAPTHAGGFCFDYSGAGGGCDRDRQLQFANGLSIPGRVTLEDGAIPGEFLLNGQTLIHKGTVAIVQFEDGDSARVPLVWVSPPIDAGFFLYEVPQQHRRIGHWPSRLILTDDQGHQLARVNALPSNFRYTLGIGGLSDQSGPRGQ